MAGWTRTTPSDGTAGKGRVRRGWLPAVVTALLLAPAAALMAAEGADAATSRTLAITSATAHPTVPFGAFDGQAPKVFDVDGDGDQEIIAQNDNQWVYVFDARTGGLLAEMKTTFPAGWGARSMNAPEVAIVSGDGKVHVIVANSAATITSYTYDKAGSTSSKYKFNKDWERRLTDCFSNPGMDSKPVLADLDKDGRLDIIAATEELGVFALRDNGALLWKKCIGGGNAEPSVGDLNQDSWPDVVFGSDGGIVTAMNGRTGGTLWSFDARSRYNLGTGSMPVGAAIGQLDGAGGPDVVVGARDSHDSTNWANDHALLLALSSTGSLLWGKQDAMAAPLTYTHPIITDAAHDGQAEVYWADWNTIGHKPPANEADSWKSTGPAHFYRYDKAGNLVWRQTLGTWWNNKDTPLADVDADGVQEMLANGPGSNGHDGVWYLDTRNGAKEAWIDLYPYKLNRAPVVADLYGNGRMQWVAEVAPLWSGTGAHGIVIYDTGSPYSSAWPHMPYPPRGTGTGTVTSSPTPSPTTSSGPLSASFSVPSGVNEWWVEVHVTANQALSKVEAQVNGGAWTALQLQSWGNWAKSFYVAKGSHVVFRATSASGATATSGTYTWLAAAATSTTTTTSAGTTTTTTATTFKATFTPKSAGNDWWVEVAVTANQPLAKVEARVDYGSWVTLDKTSWGTWAKSIYAPHNSKVSFRATSTSGSTVTSGAWQWP